MYTSHASLDIEERRWVGIRRSDAALIVTARTIAEARSELVLSSALRPVEGSKDCRRAQPNSAGRGWAGVLAALPLGLRH